MTLGATGQAPAFGANVARDCGDDDGSIRSGVAPLSDYGLLKVHGADAASFLQAQLTNDVAGLAGNEVRLAGYCSVKGRLMASFWVWRDVPAQTYWMACSRDIAAATARRLAMFVLRAKVRIEDMSDRVALLGILRVEGAHATAPVVEAQTAEVPLPPVHVPASLAARLNPPAAETAADVTVTRALQPVAAEGLEETLQQLMVSGVRVLSTQVWRRLEVLSGIARINAGNRELFVPQMVNFELVGGVSFKKGCYPGQEIVARSQYLGKLKRRMYLGVGAGPVPTSGADVEIPGSATAEPVGQVVLAAALGNGERFAVLFEGLTSLLDTAGATATEQQPAVVRVGRSTISLLPLPYSVPAGASAPRRVVAASGVQPPPAAAPAVGEQLAAPDAAG